MSKEVQVIMGVCQTDFYNHKLFEGVEDGLHEGLKLYREGKYEYVGVAVGQTEDGRVTPEFISEAYQKYMAVSFGALALIRPKLFQLGV